MLCVWNTPIALSCFRDLTFTAITLVIEQVRKLFGVRRHA
jgi:hypothetical protein